MRANYIQIDASHTEVQLLHTKFYATYIVVTQTF